MRDCYYCNYCTKEETVLGDIRYYYNDLDCFIDPCEPICNEDYCNF